MARLRRVSISAVNIRCHKEHKPTKYREFVETLASMKMSVPVFGDTHILMYEPRVHSKHTVTGLLAKYTRIDMEREWIDLAKQEYASDDQLQRVRIPENLAPHGELMRYFLYPEEHLFVFQTYSRGAQMSPNLMETYFRRAASVPDIENAFGQMDVTVVPTQESLDRIFGIEKLRRLTIYIRRPNADHLSTADTVYERLKSQNAEAVKEEYVAQDGKSFSPDDGTRELAAVARDNGFVTGTGKDGDGNSMEESTQEHPLSVSARYDLDQETEISVLERLSEEIHKDWIAR